ncbi:uncharacterized [Tachysurus ichikawai]
MMRFGKAPRSFSPLQLLRAFCACRQDAPPLPLHFLAIASSLNKWGVVLFGEVTLHKCASALARYRSLANRR